MYLQNAPQRAWDGKRVIKTTANIEHAKTFTTEVEANQFLSLCVQTGRKFRVEPKQSVLTH